MNQKELEELWLSSLRIWLGVCLPVLRYPQPNVIDLEAYRASHPRK